MNDNKPEVTSFPDEKLLEDILDSFSEATGLRAMFTNLDGRPVFLPRSTDAPKFCKLVNSRAEYKCFKSYATAGREAVKWDEPYVFRCHAGLIGLAAPVVMNGLHIGNIICGQVLMWEPEDFFWEEIREMTAGINVDFEQLKQAAGMLRVISARQAKSAANLLYITANAITETRVTIKKQRKVIEEQQAELNRRIMEKNARSNSSSFVPVYSVRMERELLHSIREGKPGHAARILDDIMLCLLPEYSTRPNYVKARILELLVLVSRALADRGCDVEELLELNMKYTLEMSKIKLADQLYLWVKKVLAEYFEHLSKAKKDRTTRVLEKVVKYVEAEYSKNLTLDSLAQLFYYSPCYLSSIFKKELGVTFVDYLTQARVKEAKKLLLNTNKTVSQVAAEVGFNSETYFSRVFKKLVGMPPGEYRKLAKIE
ncbi:PocR ligand-binding domain-containing protein [Desulfoscipio geothermicus]|uniref:Two-component system, response regulator YesN n=1 Tax=Desulfoscipio geothermicus DSM 3669 TaxID=1121426 RepID=A0A1I6DEV8_9FIRM|nr:PocR ligand-binding domain-containing protein [Desulfoscipio geothermicus]SFR03911.1 two-component system, response regulator YesN [Desulfoscipio geothermicus DSM 3669]